MKGIKIFAAMLALTFIVIGSAFTTKKNTTSSVQWGLTAEPQESMDNSLYNKYFVVDLNDARLNEEESGCVPDETFCQITFDPQNQYVIPRSTTNLIQSYDILKTQEGSVITATSGSESKYVAVELE